MSICLMKHCVLLYVSFADKERAKAIAGRQWHPALRCWIYPRTPETVAAIRREFPDALMETVDVESVTAADTASETRVAELEESLQALQAEADQLRTANGDLRAANTELSAANAERQRQLDTAPVATQPIPATPEAIIKQIAIEGAGSDTGFAKYIAWHPLDRSLPLDLAKLVEGALRALTGKADRSLGFNDLLSLADRTTRLSRSASDAAHVIRHQRNLISHEVVAPETVLPRAALCLLAAALFWRELPRAAEKAA